MANELAKVHTIITDTTGGLTGGATVLTTQTIPAGAIITSVIWQNVAATTVTATLTLNVDTTAVTTAIALASATANTCTPAVLLTSVGAVGSTTASTSNNGGKISITSSAATFTGTCRAIVTYIL